MIKLRQRKKVYSTLTTKEAAEIVANNRITWRPILKRHEINKTCPFCGSEDTLYNSDYSRKCTECGKVFEV